MTAQGNGYLVPLSCGCVRNLSTRPVTVDGDWHCTDHGWVAAA